MAISCAFIFTPFWIRPWASARLVLRSIAYQPASAPAFFMPSTSGPTSLVPKSTDVFVYTGSRPSAGTAYCCNPFTAALEDGDTPYPMAATFDAPSAFMIFGASVVWIPAIGGEFPNAEMTFSLPGAP